MVRIYTSKDGVMVEFRIKIRRLSLVEFIKALTATILALVALASAIIQLGNILGIW